MVLLVSSGSENAECLDDVSFAAAQGSNDSQIAMPVAGNVYKDPDRQVEGGSWQLRGGALDAGGEVVYVDDHLERASLQNRSSGGGTPEPVTPSFEILV